MSFTELPGGSIRLVKQNGRYASQFWCCFNPEYLWDIIWSDLLARVNRPVDGVTQATLPETYVALFSETLS